MILQHSSLKLQNEDSLLEFILSLYQKDRLYFPLFEYIIFSNVTKDLFERFLDEFIFDDLNLTIWHSICNRIKLPKFIKIKGSDQSPSNGHFPKNKIE